VTRRQAVLSGSAALVGAAALRAEDRNAAENANVQLVTDFCAATKSANRENEAR